MVTAARQSERSPAHLLAWGEESASLPRAAGAQCPWWTEFQGGRERGQSGRAEGKEGLRGYEPTFQRAGERLSGDGKGFLVSQKRGWTESCVD